MNPLTWSFWEWLAIGISLHFLWDISKNILRICQAIRNDRRPVRRKQDWSPRDPA